MPIQETESIWHNGKLVPWAEATTHVMTHALLYGTCAFEGIRCYDTKHQGPAIFRLREHLARLRKSAEMLAYERIPSDEVIVNELRRTLEANRMWDGVHVRLTLSRGLKYTSGLDPRINTAGCTIIS